MKNLGHKRFVCFIFITVLLISGMLVKVDAPHSYFACNTKVVSDSEQYTATKPLIIPDYYKTETLQERTTHYLKDNSAKRTTIRRNQPFSSTVSCSFQEKQYYYEVSQHSHQPCVTSNHAVTIEYIHRQDGAK